MAPKLRPTVSKPMTPDQWRRVNELFDQAVDRPPGDWPGVLAQARGSGPEVARELEALLRAHGSEHAGDFLSRPVASLSHRSLMSRMGRILGVVRTYDAGEVVGDFQIQKLVGEGAFAKVYLARQISLARQVALKVTADVGKEARVMAGLEHDHIVQVFSETVLPGGIRLICMQFVHGCTLQALIEALAKMPPHLRSGQSIIDLLDQSDTGNTIFNPAALRDRELLARADYLGACLILGSALAEALCFAHERGILHLDVKPANIMLNRYGRPMLTDFNVSLTPEDVAEADTANLGGTLAYMSPEQHEVFTTRNMALMPKIDHRSDIYSLGIVVTELLTCAKVHRGVSPDGKTVMLSGMEAFPDEVAAVLHVAVQERPEERFATAARLSAAFDNCHTMTTIRRSIPNSGKWPQFALKHPVFALVFLALLPQFMGSAVNITYNSIRIVSDLTPAQKDLFLAAIMPYNLVFYPLGVWIIWRQLAFLHRALSKRRDRYIPDPAGMAVLRRRVLRTPYALLVAATVGWLPGAIVFPAVINWFQGPLPRSVFVHFAISFLSSWLIALTYSFLLLETIVLQIVYPRFWTGTCDIRGAAKKELRSIISRLKVFQIMAGIIPLAGAAMIVGAGPEIVDPQRYYVFQIMVVGLISLGMCGFVFAIKTSENVKRTVMAFAPDLVS